MSSAHVPQQENENNLLCDKMDRILIPATMIDLKPTR